MGQDCLLPGMLMSLDSPPNHSGAVRRPRSPEQLAALARAIQAGTFRPDLQRLAEAMVAAPPRPRTRTSH